jgi:hypothetical protein
MPRSPRACGRKRRVCKEATANKVSACPGRRPRVAFGVDPRLTGCSDAPARPRRPRPAAAAAAAAPPPALGGAARRVRGADPQARGQGPRAAPRAARGATRALACWRGDQGGGAFSRRRGGRARTIPALRLSQGARAAAGRATRMGAAGRGLRRRRGTPRDSSHARGVPARTGPTAAAARAGCAPRAPAPRHTAPTAAAGAAQRDAASPRRGPAPRLGPRAHPPPPPSPQPARLRGGGCTRARCGARGGPGRRASGFLDCSSRRRSRGPARPPRRRAASAWPPARPTRRH